MTHRLLAILAFALMTAFLAILVWYVPRWDLAGVIAATVLLAGWDVLQLVRRHKARDQE